MVQSCHAPRIKDHGSAYAASCGKILRRALLGLLAFTFCIAYAAAETSKDKGTATPEQLALINRAAEFQLQSLQSPTPYQFQERLEGSQMYATISEDGQDEDNNDNNDDKDKKKKKSKKGIHPNMYFVFL